MSHIRSHVPIHDLIGQNADFSSSLNQYQSRSAESSRVPCSPPRLPCTAAGMHLRPAHRDRSKSGGWAFAAGLGGFMLAGIIFSFYPQTPPSLSTRDGDGLVHLHRGEALHAVGDRSSRGCFLYCVHTPYTSLWIRLPSGCY